jgi:hypothetical protein
MSAEMHFRVCLSSKRFAKIAAMRSFPVVVVAWILLCLGPIAAQGQQIHCYPCRNGFGQVQIGSSVSFNFQLTNVGTKILRIASVGMQGSAFTFGTFATPVKISPGKSVELPVIFTPTARGYTRASISVSSNSPFSPLYLHVAGIGVSAVGPELTVTPSTLSFGNVNVGSSATLQGTLSASNSAVTISSDGSTSSEFAISGIQLPVTIPAGQSLGFKVKFTPNASGGATGQAGFTSNALNSPSVEQLTGTGVAPGSHTVTLTWEPGDGNAVGYNVYRSTVSGGPYQEINVALDASTNYIDSAVVSGTTYYYVVTEVNAAGQESAYSNQTTAVVPSP